MSDQTMARFKARQVALEPGWRGQSSMHREAKTPLLMLFAVTGIVLLIACANVANLLLARGAGRAMEMGVRLALGASRRQLITQLLTESVLLASLGGLASVVVAKWTLNSIAALLPSDAGDTLQFTLQPAVLLFAAALAVATGIVFGMFPAWHSTRTELVTVIRANAGQISGARSAARFRASLVTVQIALATSLLIAAGLFVKSLVNVTHVDLGVHVEHVVTFSISPERSGYDSTRALLLYGRVEDALAAIPGVDGCHQRDGAPPGGRQLGHRRGCAGLLVRARRGQGIAVQRSRHRLLRHTGRCGSRLAGSSPWPTARAHRQVAVVNQAFVKKFSLGQGAVGKFMSTSGPDSLKIEIVGVVPDVKYSDVKQVVPAVFYLPWRQDTHVGGMNFYVRSPQPEMVLRALPGVLKRDRSRICPVEDLKTMPQQIRENVFLDRMISILSARSRCSPRCSRRWACTACWPTVWRSARARSGCAWPSAPTLGGCAQWSCVRCPA